MTPNNRIHRTPFRPSLGLLSHPDRRTPGVGDARRWVSERAVRFYRCHPSDIKLEG